MYVSTSLLHNALKQYNDYQKTKKEGFRENYSGWDSAGAGFSAGFVAFFVVFAIIFFILELIVLVYSIIIALRCTKGGGERIVHLVLAIVFTLPYALLNALFNNCAISVLRGQYTGGVTEEARVDRVDSGEEFSTFKFGGCATPNSG
jgi:hypothetical protein